MANINFNDHLDSTNEMTLEMVKMRALKGVLVLTGRTFFLNALSFFATLLLTIFLEPKDFGIFWIVSAVVNFLAYFSDIGLAAALIQKRKRVTYEELKTTFTIQEGLVLSLSLGVLVITPFLQEHYHLSKEGTMLLWALLFSFVLSSLKTIPSVLLERELKFTTLVIPQILENLSYNITSVILAWKGFGISSFTYAVVIRGVVGLASMYILKPWRPGISLNRSALKRLLSFGLPYQANTLLAVIKDDGMTLVLGSILGANGVGLLGWAQKWAYMPLRLFMDHVLKVTFPAFSRIQAKKKELSSAVSLSIFFICFLVFPTTAGLLVVAPTLIEIVPRYEKWRPALLVLSLVSVNTFFAAFTTQLTNLLNAIGKIRLTFKLMLMWTILTWILVPTLGKFYNLNGAALGYAIVGLSSVVAFYVSYRILKFDFLKSVGIPGVATFIMVLVLIGIKTFLKPNFLSVVIISISGLIIYLGVMYILAGSFFVKNLKKGLDTIFRK